MSNTATVKLNGKYVTAERGNRLSSVIHGELPCGGHGKCGKCKVYAKGALSPLSETELLHLTSEEISSGIRLACLTSILGDCEVNEIKRTSDAQIITNGEADLDSLDPSFSKYGAAIDIGTTTLAAKLFDPKGRLLSEASALNPQSAFGADVISRIEASLKGSGPALAELIVNALDEMLNELSDKASIDPRDIDAAVITGNTAMLHLLTNTSPEPLSHAPFAAERLFGEILSAKELGLCSLSDNASIYLPPCIAAFVGADTVCAILASGMCGSDNTSLLTDIGTNGEMALLRNGELHVCSTAAGPAFEGVGISMGMRGGVGAIDKVMLQNGMPFAHVIGNVPPVGICGSGLVDAIACLLMNETLDETGYLDDDTAEIANPVVITQQDVRMVQLAKSAICAGIRTLLHKSGINAEDISAFYLAGGFGSYLDIKNAGRIGLIPEELTDKVKVIGNAALTGAAMLLLDKDLRGKARSITENVKVADLATDPFFAEEYMTGMLFE
jgi:uncharacterized 2Fe-2S/4Fe-4S cluster protein (DUF4445 family)